MSRSVEFEYSDRLWAIIPPPGDRDADARWMDEQVAVMSSGTAADAGQVSLAAARAAAAAALAARRPEAVTSLLFRPTGDLVFGLVHVVALEGGTGGDGEWWRPGDALTGEPVITMFSAASIPEGRRLVYVLAESFDDGDMASAIAYAFEVADARVIVYSEPARVDVTAMLADACDLLVDSMVVTG